MKHISYLFFSLLILIDISPCLSVVKLTNLYCKNLTNLVEYKICRIKAIDRNTNALYVTAALSRPVYNMFLDIKLEKRANGWKPFLYTFNNIDLCRFLSGQRRNSPFAYLFNVFGKFSNMNHSCPYEGDLIVDKLIFREGNVGNLPLPLGEYGLITTWKSDGIPFGTVKGYISYTNYSKTW